MNDPLLPGSTIGVMGSGQLGRMLAIAARRMGYRIATFSPDRGTPMGPLVDREVTAPYDDEAAVSAFAREIDVLTFEFENIPVESVAWAARYCPVRPSGKILSICQHRLREKEFLAGAGIALPAFRKITGVEELKAAAGEIGLPAVLKSAAFGYDGKGQRTLRPGDDLSAAWQKYEGSTAVLEAFVPFEKEVSVIVARGLHGEVATYPVFENLHTDHILDVTLLPARIAPESAERARKVAVAVAEALDLVGLLAVEMFLLPNGGILVNELAPRPHNSGHATFDASVTTQFEQQLRAVCGLPLGSTETLRPAAMANLLGDLWAGGEPDWAAVLAMPEVKLHLYGKTAARRGRKMGHLVAFGNDVDAAAATVRKARKRLRFTKKDILHQEE
ncbi:MAG TPA: 5-(carboxyamino)imidazole ribonucleotide synthase [Chthoniobacteraceae bacterium]|nr:5-(carboxyamino)imidazole ribonucleotide synthase [Chthoniobacteraceae bacterium]